ncbi:GDPmannose 4,6-dehydratase [Roseimicrobium gellanilyticum]|uniref:GDP-mannose 4,6-dehydratase n=1 Tax=Roseimicrobium gellanilyticum TaxID=748857 RepID=A0A366HR77_9BACT|nr:GDP-mannose 4,6-dehydratase [Roseimicrobium gellanilyticum]RBP45042.1 GDPmannose 4,6-dehydratase [Roseimicrobium gellanilyticum]
MKKALISGITGQDGSYLLEHLLAEGYEVHGIVRRASSFNRSRIEHLRTNPDVYDRLLFLHYSDLTDGTSLRRIFKKVQPREFYHLAGQSHVGLSFEIPESTCEEAGMAMLTILEICRDMDNPPRIFHAASSEVFGSSSKTTEHDENSPFRPVTPYGCAKAFAANLCRVYRDSYGLFISNGIMFNHESPRRGENFVTKKIAASAGRIAAGSQEVLELGSLDTTRDWGYAPEFVRAMRTMLNQAKPDDFVLGTGTSMSVREFAIEVFSALGMKIAFEGRGLQECARDVLTGRTVITVHPRFYRSFDPSCLQAGIAKARSVLGWNPTVTGRSLAELMALAEYKADMQASYQTTTAEEDGGEHQSRRHVPSTKGSTFQKPKSSNITDGDPTPHPFLEKAGSGV